MKRPSFQFYPGDWLRDTALRSCSIGARGLWIEMLALMHEGEPYGHLKVGKKALDTATLARMVGSTDAEITPLLNELEQAGVFSKTGSTIYSRRMVRDERLREKRAEFGHLGAEYGKRGKDHGIKGGRPKNPPSSGDIETPMNPPPAFASAFASASASQKLYGKPAARVNGKDPRACAFGDCTKPGSRSHSTSGGPFYCSEHYDGSSNGPRHVTEHLKATTPAAATPDRAPEPPAAQQAKGKFED